MIEFEFVDEKIINFYQIINDQFFINKVGELCQKIDDDSYVILTDSKGAHFVVIIASTIPLK